MFARKKVFLIKQGLEPTIVGTNYRAKAPRFSHLDCGIIEQKLWFESPFCAIVQLPRQSCNAYVALYRANGHNSLGKVAMRHYIEPINIIH
jgi:hypothetical protein